jgi:hypothetical protein
MVSTETATASASPSTTDQKVGRRGTRRSVCGAARSTDRPRQAPRRWSTARGETRALVPRRSGQRATSPSMSPAARRAKAHKWGGSPGGALKMLARVSAPVSIRCRHKSVPAAPTPMAAICVLHVGVEHLAFADGEEAVNANDRPLDRASIAAPARAATAPPDCPTPARRSCSGDQ